MITPGHQSKPEPIHASAAEALRRLDEIERRVGELRSKPDQLGGSTHLLDEVSALLAAQDTESQRLRRQRDGLARELSDAERMIQSLQCSLAAAREESDAAMTEISTLRSEVASKLRKETPSEKALPIEQHVRREIGKAQSELETTAANLDDYRAELDRRFYELTDWAAALEMRERDLERWAHVLEASLSPLAPGPTQTPVFVPPNGGGFQHPAAPPASGWSMGGAA